MAKFHGSKSTSENSLCALFVCLLHLFVCPTGITTNKQKMTGGTPEVRSDKSLTLLTFDI